MLKSLSITGTMVLVLVLIISDLGAPLSPPAPKEGDCPMVAQGCPSDRKPDPIECSFDRNCTGSLKCCGTSCFGRMCMAPQGSRAGTCPDPTVMKIACDGPRVVEKCFNDFDCSYGKKCCSSPCGGVECFEAGTTKPVEKPGTCRPHIMIACLEPTSTSSPEVKNCVSDGDCEGDLKCCSTPCSGMTCQTPEPILVVDPPPPSDGHVNPGSCPMFFVGCLPGQANDSIECSSDLSCEPNMLCCPSPCNGKKCYPSSVVKQGTCEDPKREVSLCMAGVYDKSVAQCSHDGQCPGEQRCCPQTCVKPLCALPIPVKHDGQCPGFNDPAGTDAGKRKFTCKDDGDCASTQKCCTTGAVGQQCMPAIFPSPKTSVARSGSCPSEVKPSSEALCRADSCTDDQSCPSQQKCCKNTCGKMQCVDPPKPQVCPVFDKNAVCKNDKRKPYECSTRTGGCADGSRCCEYECSGTRCESDLCDAPDLNIQCYAPEKRECNSSSQCGANQICCDIYCGGSRCKPTSSSNGLIKEPEKPTDCGFVCAIFCEFGNVLDERGCPTCSCNPDPCIATTCEVGKHCEAKVVNCIKAPCPPIVECKACDPVLCDVYCPHGHVLDKYGCETCACYDPCAATTCMVGQYCEATVVTCIREPCPPIAECKTCPVLENCGIRCAWGHAYDQNGCELCQCRDDPCKDVKCSSGQVCEVREVQCIRAPCPPQGVCVDQANKGYQSAPAPLVCPDPEPSCPTSQRRAACVDDSTCQGRKCCDTGCNGRKICLAPVRAGKCPVVDPKVIKCAAPSEEDKKDECGTDVVCPGTKKCCAHGCPGYGKRCLEPQP